MWMTDKEGRILNTPIDMWNHFMDATRYGMETLRPRSGDVKIKQAAWVGRAKQRKGNW